ncbi:hypothetical protein PANI_CDS0074 [Maribacter phage Panino]
MAYIGEYGIGLHPESFAFFGTRIYHIDKARGCLLRLGIDGYTEISKRGMNDYFRTLGDQNSHVGGYDPYNDEYLVRLGVDSTVAFIEGAEGGFTSFYEYDPERLVGVNNRMYSIKNGQLYLHDSNQTRNNFYGVQKTASITTLFNDAPNDMKHWKSINTESTNPWDVSITTPMAIGTISKDEFSLEEGEYYAYIRQNENTDVDSGSIEGLGVIQNMLGNALRFDELPRNIAIGDIVYEWLSGTDEIVQRGVVTDIDWVGGFVTLNTVSFLSNGDFVVFGKNARVNGEAIKGYYMEITLTNDSTTDEELFTVKAEAVRSFD